jgi:hypothetical protein
MASHVVTRWRLGAATTVTVVTAMVFAPLASSDDTADLRSAVAAKRGSCAALQPDPLLDQVAQNASLQTQKYANHTARFQPMTDPMPMLRQLSYPAGKAILLSGFANVHDFEDAPQRAIYSATLFGWDTIPDCTYTRYGADLTTDANTGITTTAVVLAGD